MLELKNGNKSILIKLTFHFR